MMSNGRRVTSAGRKGAEIPRRGVHVGRVVNLMHAKPRGIKSRGGVTVLPWAELKSSR